MKKRILVVDDEAPIHDAFRKMLPPAEYDLVGAFDGVEMDARIDEFPPDLIILDVMMKGEDGISILRRLKALKGTAPIPVILMSGICDTVPEAKTGLNLGAAEYVAKPFAVEVMIANIRRHTGMGKRRTSVA